MGFALGIAYLVFAQPTLPLLLAGILVALAGLALRGFAAGYLEKGKGLAVAGPYARTRNPLYLGSFLIGLGLSVASARWALGAAFVAYFLAIYWPVMNREAKALRQKHGEAFDIYAHAVPLFLPQWGRSPAREDKFLWSRYRSNREYEATLGFLAVVIFLALKTYLR
jgi:protein-S-isoprenylcysteine O-methyltransferase Ste14